jgi:hypothetical protein
VGAPYERGCGDAADNPPDQYDLACGSAGAAYAFATGVAPTMSTVIFDANLGAGTMTAQSAADDRALTANGFTRSGFNFTEWNTNSSGTGTRYDDGGTYPFSASTSAIMYAQWSPWNTVTLSANDGTGRTVTQSATTAAGPGVEYTDGAAFPFATATTLYAQWQASPAGELPTLVPGDGLLLEDGVEVPVDVAVEQDTDVVLRTLSADFELRLAGDCTTGCTVVDDETGGETIYLVEDGATRVSGYGFKAGTYVDVWMFSDARYLGSLLVADDGTYSGDFALEGVPVGEHTVQANGISNDDQSRSANLGVVVQTSAETPTGDLPATGSQPWPLTLGAVLAMALGLVALARVKRVTPTRPM